MKLYRYTAALLLALCVPAIHSTAIAAESSSSAAEFLNSQPKVMFQHADFLKATGACPMVIQTMSGSKWITTIEWTRISAIAIYETDQFTVTLHGPVYIRRDEPGAQTVDRSNSNIFGMQTRADAKKLRTLLRETRSACGGKPGAEEINPPAPALP